MKQYLYQNLTYNIVNQKDKTYTIIANISVESGNTIYIAVVTLTVDIPLEFEKFTTRTLKILDYRIVDAIDKNSLIHLKQLSAKNSAQELVKIKQIVTIKIENLIIDLAKGKAKNGEAN